MLLVLVDMFYVGRQPMLAIDMMFNVRSPDMKRIATSKYIHDSWKRLQWAYKLAIATIRKEMWKHKRNYDKT